MQKQQIMKTGAKALAGFEHQNQEQLNTEMPVIKEYYQDFKSEYLRNKNTDSLISGNQFSDKTIIQEFNKHNENKPLIKDFISNIRSPQHEIGNEAEKEMCSKLIKHTYESDSTLVDTTLQVLKDPSNIPIESVDQVGNSLTYLYGATGNLSRSDTAKWYFNQLKFGPPKSLEPLIAKIKHTQLSEEDMTHRIQNIDAETDDKISRITKATEDKLNEGFIDKILNQFDLDKILTTLLEHKLVLGGTAAATIGFTSFYVYKNPKIFIEWYDFIRDTRQQQEVISNRKTYRTINQIEKEPIRDLESASTKKIMEELFDRFYINVKRLFFGR